MRKKLIVLIALLALGLCGRVCAAEQPDPERLCSVTFVMEYDAAPLEGGSLTLYRVGQIAPGGDGFLPVAALGQDAPGLDDLSAPGLARALYERAARNLEGRTAPIAEGRALFSGLEPGVYVVCQAAGKETPGYAAIEPFLLSMPQWQDGAYVYDLTAAPKVPLVPAPPATEPPAPTEPGDTPDLPQTGQLNWPVPLMAVMGLAFFGLGWSLFFRTGRRDV